MSLNGLDGRIHGAVARALRLIGQTLRDELPHSASTTEFSALLRQISAACFDRHLSLLPLLTCEAVGGRTEQAIPLVAAWQLSRLSAKLLDDVADGESAYSAAQAVGLATSLLFLAPLALCQLSKQRMPSDRVNRLAQSLDEAGLRACAGQHLELTAQPAMAPDAWLQIASAKSGEPLAWAAWAGAFAAGAAEDALANLREYGFHLGILLQIADDFNGIWHDNGASDLKSGQLNLAVCYAYLVADARQRGELETLLKGLKKGEGEALSGARRLLTQMGAQAYLLVAGQDRRQQALAALQKNDRPAPPLIALLDGIWPALAEATLENKENAKPA